MPPDSLLAWWPSRVIVPAAFAAIALLNFGLPVPTAHAQPAEGETAAAEAGEEEEEDTARSHFRVGQLLYGEGRFQEAAEEFDRAYELSGRSELLYNAYLAHRDAGHVPEATDRLRQYLAETPDAQNRETLEGRLSAMEATVAEQERIAQMSEEERAALEADRARAAEEAEEAQRRAEELQAERARDAERRNPLPYAILGAGGALIVGSVVSGVVTRTRINELDENCPGGTCVSSFDVASARADARRTAITTDVLLFTGLATAGTGAVLLILQRRGSGGDDEETTSAARRPRVSGGCGPRGCSAELEVNF